MTSIISHFPFQIIMEATIFFSFSSPFSFFPSYNKQDLGERIEIKE